MHYFERVRVGDPPRPTRNDKHVWPVETDGNGGKMHFVGFRARTQESSAVCPDSPRHTHILARMAMQGGGDGDGAMGDGAGDEGESAGGFLEAGMEEDQESEEENEDVSGQQRQQKSLALAPAQADMAGAETSCKLCFKWYV